MPPTGGDSQSDLLENYPRERGSTRLVGVTTPGTPIYYDPETHTAMRGELDGDEFLPDWYSGEVLPEEPSVDDVVEGIEEEVGWDALTSYADEHLPDEIVDSNDGDGSNGND